LYSDIPNYTCFPSPESAIEVTDYYREHHKNEASRTLNKAVEYKLFWRKLSLIISV